MDDDEDKTAKAVEDELQTSRKRSDALGKALDEAQDKRPVKPDHANDGGVI
jgi:hypothetical protein